MVKITIRLWVPFLIETICVIVWMMFGGGVEIQKGNFHALVATIALGIAIITSAWWAKKGRISKDFSRARNL